MCKITNYGWCFKKKIIVYVNSSDFERVFFSCNKCKHKGRDSLCKYYTGEFKEQILISEYKHELYFSDEEEI